MTVHAAEKNALLSVGAGAEVGVEDIRMRPEFEREAKNLELRVETFSLASAAMRPRPPSME
jgi:hypothetical protein